MTEQDTPEGIIHHAFDPATGELTETSTANTDIAYAYNNLGELTTTTVNELNGQELATPLVTTDAYDAAGNKTSETLPNGVVTSWTDDDLNRLVSMTETLNGTTLFSQTFTLKDDGTRASSDQTQLQPDGSTITTDTTWSNNALGELTSETLSSSDSSQNYTDIFKYDLVGNRLTSAHTGPGNGADENITNTYNGDDELTKEVSTLSGETDLRYDPNGSLTTSTNGSDVTTYGYDVRNKMTSANVNGVTTTYDYDDAGNRVGETTGGVTTFYLTDDDNPTGYAQPIEQKASAAAAPSVTYIIGDRVLAQADASGAVSYLLTDGHGSTRALTGSAGAVTQTFNYTAFGGAIGFNPAAAGTVFLFGGDAVYDPASGLYLNGDGTRPRDGSTFTQRDPTSGNNSDPPSLHKYLYGAADPTENFDPSGNDSLAEVSTANSIQTIISSAYAGTAQGVTTAARSVARGESIYQALLSFSIDTAIGIIGGFAYFKLLGVIAGTSSIEIGSLSDITAETLVADAASPPGATGGGSQAVTADLLADVDPAVMSEVVAERMREIGIPDAEIGNVDRPGEGSGAYVQRDPAVGGTQSIPGGSPGVNIDTGVFLDSLKDVPGWAEASIQDRIDVIAAHEYTELHTPPEAYQVYDDPNMIAEVRHEYAIQNAPDTPLGISENARAILTAEAVQEGYGDE